MSRVMTGALAFFMLFAFSCGTMNSSVKNDFPREGFAFISKTVQLKDVLVKANVRRWTCAPQVLVMLLEFLIEEHILLLRHTFVMVKEVYLDSVDQTIKMKVRTITLHEYEAVVIKKRSRNRRLFTFC